MINRVEAYNKAFAQKESELRSRKALCEKKLAQLAVQEPRLREIENRISYLGAQVAITALSGDAVALKELQDEITALSREKMVLCDDAGVEEIKYDCELCRDTGYVSGRICECVHSLAREMRMKALADEFPVDECRFDNFDLNYYPNTEVNGVNPRKRMTSILKLCREYVINFGKDSEESKNLLFFGGAGLGKTHLSLAMVSELTAKGFDVIYGSAYNLFSAMENEHFSYRNNDSYTAAVECDLLVIDDLGSEFVSPYIQTLLYNIINTRLLAKRPMIINTNIGMSEIENKYTPRISSRLIGNFKVKKFAGQDIRQLRAMEK